MCRFGRHATPRGGVCMASLAGMVREDGCEAMKNAAPAAEARRVQCKPPAKPIPCTMAPRVRRFTAHFEGTIRAPRVPYRNRFTGRYPRIVRSPESGNANDVFPLAARASFTLALCGVPSPHPEGTARRACEGAQRGRSWAARIPAGVPAGALSGSDHLPPRRMNSALTCANAAMTAEPLSPDVLASVDFIMGLFPSPPREVPSPNGNSLMGNPRTSSRPGGQGGGASATITSPM
jgi:hypothetical protein